MKNVQIAIQDKHEVIETQAVEIADLKEKLKAAYEDIQKVLPRFVGGCCLTEGASAPVVGEGGEAEGSASEDQEHGRAE